MKPLVFLVDSVITHNFKQYIRTAFETIQDLLPNRKEPESGGYWGNMYITNYHHPVDGHYETQLTTSPMRMRYEALSTAVIDKVSDYVYVIPCNSDMDVTNIIYLQMLSRENLFKIANNNINILFDYSFETFDHSYTTASNIRRLGLYIRQHNAEYSGKIILSSTNELPDPINREDIKFGFPIRSINLPWRALMDRPQFKSEMPTPIDLDKYLVSRKDYMFMNLNQHPRVHRVFFIHRLFATGLITLSRTSYMARKTPSMTPFVAVVEQESHLFTEKKNNISIDDLATMMRASSIDQPPIILPNDLSANTSFNHLHNPDWCYDTCFDIIAETGSFAVYNSPSVTEKTFKAMFYKRPYMVNGDAGSLRMIQKMGFRTFPNVFNETYDSFTGMFDRHGMIFENIRLFKDDYARLMHRIRGSMYDIEYNYARLMDPGSIENIILETLSSELSR